MAPTKPQELCKEQKKPRLQVVSSLVFTKKALFKMAGKGKQPVTEICFTCPCSFGLSSVDKEEPQITAAAPAAVSSTQLLPPKAGADFL